MSRTHTKDSYILRLLTNAKQLLSKYPTLWCYLVDTVRTIQDD